MRRWILRLLVGIALVAALPATAHADPVTITLVVAAVIDIAVPALIGAGIAYGVQAIVGAVRGKSKPGQTPTQQLQITTAAEGEGWPRIWGTCAVGAKVIDKGTVTVTEVQNGSGKRRGPPTTRYSCSLMIGVCENVGDTVMGVSRIWADGELLYSADPSGLTGTNPAVFGTANGPFLANLLHSRRMQILYGQSNQTDRCDWFATGGDDLVPAYRGIVTICFDDMDLTPFYNRIPQIQVEVVVDGFMIQEECVLAGFDPSEIDVESSITQSLVINGPTPFKNILELFPSICVAEVDGTLKFMNSLATSSATVAYGELGAIKAGREDQSQQPVKFFMQSEQSATVPGRVEVTYLDPDNKYQQASVGYARQYGEATGVVQLNVPFAMTRDSARSYASEFIARSWTERDSLKVSLLPKYLKYHPGDVLTITAPNGQLIDMRITAMDVHPGTHPVEITGVRQLRNIGVGNPDDFIPDTPGDADDAPALPSVSVLANVPPAVDDHDNFDGIYWAAGPLANSTTTPPAEWKGAFLFRNACGATETNKKYEEVGRTRTAAVIGKARTALANGSGVDTVNTVDIDFPYGDGTDTIIAIHDDAFTNTTTANLAILGKEWIQFRDIDDVSASYSLPAGRVWRLEGKIKRGVRDTAAYTSTHAITNEVQTLTFGGTITGGTFTLTFNSYTTAAISWSSTNSTLVSNIDTALGALASIGGASNITTAVGTMTAGIGTITVTFVAELAGLDVPLMTRTSSLTGTAPTLEVSLTTEGQGEAFVLYNPDSVIRVGLNVDEQLDTWNFKTLTSGQQETDVVPVAFTYQPIGGHTILKDYEP